MVSSVRVLGGGWGFRGIFVRGDFDDRGALDMTADTSALNQLFGLDDVGFDSIGRSPGDILASHLALCTAVVVGPDGLEGGVNNKADDEVEGGWVLGNRVDESEATEVVFEGLFTLAFGSAGVFVAPVAVEHEMLVIVEQADERMLNDFIGGEPLAKTVDEKLLVFVVRAFAVDGDNGFFVSVQHGLNGEALEVEVGGLGCWGY